MPSDRPNKPSGGWTGKARGAAVTRHIKKHFDAKTVTSSDRRGTKGVRVQQRNMAGTSSDVSVFVWLGDLEHQEKRAATWSAQIADSLTEEGFEVSRVTDVTFIVTKAEWRFDDAVTNGMFCVDNAIMESDSGLVTARPGTVEQLRRNGWIKPDTLELTELGQQVRVHLLDKKRKREAAARRGRKARGW